MKRLLILSILCLLSTQSWSEEGCIGNCVNGYGTYTYAIGSKYVGEWGNGKRHGQGVRAYADGSKFVGKYKNGKRWSGTEYNVDGKVTATFQDGVRKE